MQGMPMKNIIRILVGVVACFWISLAFAQTAPERGPDVSALNWTFSNHEQLLEDILDSISSAEPGEPVVWTADIRLIYRFEQWEFLLRITRYVSSASATYFYTVAPNSVFEQMYALREKDHDLILEKALNLVKVERGKASSQNCPELMKLIKALESMRIQVVYPDQLCNDCSRYKLSFVSLSKSISVEMFGKSPPFTDWIDRVSVLLKKGCPSQSEIEK
jgi:hypothetical protein